MINILKHVKEISRIDLANYLIILFAFILSFPGEFKRIILILLIFILITDRNLSFEIDNNLKKIFISFLFFISYCFLSFLWTDSTFQTSLNYIRKYWYLCTIFPIYFYLKSNYIKIVISSFLLGMLISESFSYGNIFGLWEIGGGNVENPAVFMHHIFYSIFLSVTSVILLIKIISEKNLKIKVIYLIFFSTVTLNLFMNIGRTGQISLILSIITILYIHFKLKLKYIFLAILFIATLLIINYNFNSTFKKRITFIKTDIENIIHNNNYNTSLGIRFAFWILGKEILFDNPKNLFLGVGAKEHLTKANELIDEKYREFYNNKEFRGFHSTYLSITTQFGIIGLILFLYFIYQLLIFRVTNEELNIIRFAIIYIFLFSSFVDEPFYKDSSLSLLSLFIGIALIKKNLK